MIKSVTVTNPLDESIKLELRYPERSGFAIHEITGLGPSKANINAKELATIDGSVYNSARVTSRNIVLALKFMWKPTIEDVRLQSYRYFPIKKKVKIAIETDSRTCETYGYVELNEPDIFSKEEGAQISIICPDPYFYSLYKTTTIFSGIEPNFEFPFSNESLTEPLIETGLVLNYWYRNVRYEGDAETGVIVTISAIGPATGIAIYNTQTREVMRIDDDKIETITGSGLKDKDEIIINTIKGQKSIQLLRDGYYNNLLNALDRDSDWFTLQPKSDNVFSYTAETGALNLLFKIENPVVYEGV